MNPPPGTTRVRSAANRAWPLSPLLAAALPPLPAPDKLAARSNEPF